MRRTQRRNRPTARIQDLPVELLQEVFLFACTDGGRTGCSLSQVSTAFRAAVYPVRYNSIALIGMDQISRFTTHYQYVRAAAARSRHPEAYPKVRHLFIMSNRDMLRRKVYDHDDTDNDLDAAFATMSLGPGRHGHGGRGSHQSGRATTRAPLPALLRLVGTDVRTLVLATTYVHTTIFANCAPFTRLRELTIARMTGVDVPTVGAPTLPAPLFPSLEKLHIAMGVLDHSLEHLVCHWTELAPRTAVLRLSDVPRRAGAGMREAFGERPRNYDPVFPRMRLLLIQPFPVPPPERAEPPALDGQRRELVGAIADLGRHARRTTAVRLLPPNHDYGTQHAVDLWRGWLEGVNGGSGFWSGGVDAMRIR